MDRIALLERSVFGMRAALAAIGHSRDMCLCVF